MILFLDRYLIGVLKCHQTGKKDTVIWPSFVAPFQLPLLRRSNYDRKKIDLLLRPEKKVPIVITTRKKRVLVICLAGAVLVVCLAGA
jgi:hypothetical protein